MDIERSRIEEDLQGVIEGEIRCDDAFLQMYASDASIYEAKPVAVVLPQNTQDVVNCVTYAAEYQIPIIPRGAATNVIGGCVGRGIVLDFANSMRRIINVDRDSVTVEPGVVLTDLNRELASHYRRFGPDPPTRRVSTIGGILSLNASGSKWMLYGTPRDKILQLEIVLANGIVAKIDSRMGDSNETDPKVSHLESKLVSLFHRNDLHIKKYKPKTKINQAGYNIFDSVEKGQADLTRLIAGSEGTLGIITQAKLRTEPLPRNRGVAVLFFDSQEKAAQAAVEIAKLAVVACDLIDRRLLSLACESNPEYLRLIPSDAESILLVEVQAEDHATLQDRLSHLKSRIIGRRKLAFDIRSTTQGEERDLFWRLTRRIIPTLYRLRGNKRALTFIDDIAVDPTQLPKFMKVLHLTLNEFAVTASVMAHTPQGLINVRPFLDLSDEKDLDKMKRLAEAVFDRVLEFGGTISGACGDGLSRSWYLKRQYKELHQAMVAIKRTFDPLNILNPGKVIDHDGGEIDDNVRTVTLPNVEIESVGSANDNETKTELPVLQPQLVWQNEDIALAARNCNGCGRCRSTLEEERMCPMFRLSPLEEATPRAKANLVRGIVTGQLSPETVTSDEFKEVADLCFNCHQCRIDCPAKIDVPKLMVEAKANYVAVNGLKFSDWILTRLDWFYEFAGRMPRFANFLMRNSTARAMLEKMLGIARGRKLPRLRHKISPVGSSRINYVALQNNNHEKFATS